MRAQSYYAYGMSLKSDLQATIKGEAEDSPEILETYSHDASLFEVKPQVVTYPKDVADVMALVKYAAANKTDGSNLSITARSAGTDMSGGTVNDSIIADFNRHFNQILDVSSTIGHAQPGVF